MATTIAEGYVVCCKSFDKLCEALQTSDGRYNEQMSLASVLDEYGRFNSWAGNIGAHRAYGRVSLDYRLREATEIREQILTFLQYLTGTVEKAREIASGVLTPYDEHLSSSEPESESSQDDSSQETESSCSTGSIDSQRPRSTIQPQMRVLMNLILTIVANLYKMSIVIRSSNLNDDRLLKMSKIDVSYYEPFDLQHVKNKFPLADEKMVERLGRAISRRRQYLKYRESHNEKMSRPNDRIKLSRLVVTETRETLKQARESPSNEYFDPEIEHENVYAQKTISSGLSTSASTFVPPMLPTPLNLDIDVYSETGSQTSYASSTTGDKNLRVPSPPESSKHRQDFECQYCYKICRLKGSNESQRKREWKRHIFNDLQPYVCTFDCKSSKADTAFERRRDWFSHELSVHRREWSCFIAGHGAFRKCNDFIEHMTQQHKEAFRQVELPRILAISERAMEVTTTNCPLCDSEGSDDLSVVQLEKHLGQHLESLALFALPKESDKDQANSVGVAADEGSSGNSRTDSCSDVDVLETENRAILTEDKTKIPNKARYLILSIDELIQDYCAAEDRRGTKIPRGVAETLKARLIRVSTKQEKIENPRADLIARYLDLIDAGFEIPGRESLAAQALPSEPKMADMVRRIYRYLMTYIQQQFPNVSNFGSTALEFYGTLGLLVDCMVTTVPDFPNDTDLGARLKNIYDLLAAPDLMSENSELDIDFSWDFLQPKITVAESTQNLMSLGLKASRRIYAANESDQDYFMVKFLYGLQDLMSNLAAVESSLSGIHFPQKVAKELETIMWDCERDIGRLVAGSSEQTSRGRNEFLSTLEPVVEELRRLLRCIVYILHIEPLERRPYQQRVRGWNYTRKPMFREWLTSFEHSERHKAAFNVRQNGTGEWFIDTSKYIQWKHGDSSWLWLVGPIGCGKTVICSAIVNDLMKSRNTEASEAYFYCNRDDGEVYQEHQVLRSLIVQFHRATIYEPTDESLRLRRLIKDDSPHITEDEFVKVLVAELKNYVKTYIVIDGLDQYKDKLHLLEVLGGIQSLVPTLHILIISRLDCSLESKLANISPDFEDFTIGEEHVAKDIQMIARTQVQYLRASQEFKDELAERLVEQSHTMFLWANYQLERLQACNKEDEMMAILESSPPEIDTLWESALVRMSKLELDDAIEDDESTHFIAGAMTLGVLGVLTISVRPLTIGAVASFCKLCDEKFTLLQWYEWLTQDALGSFSDLLAFSSKSMKTQISQGHRLIELVHPSIRTFLSSEYIQESRARALHVDRRLSHHRMAGACLELLLGRRFESPSDEVALSSVLPYAAKYWSYHFNCLNADQQRTSNPDQHKALHVLVLELFRSQECFSHWLSIYDPDSSTPGSAVKNPSPLYYASLLGLYDVTKDLIVIETASPRLNSGKHGYPLLAAIENGHTEIVRLLLENRIHPADPNIKCDNADTALIRAISQGKSSIARILLENGADRTLHGNQHLSPLHWAVRIRNEEALRLLFECPSPLISNQDTTDFLGNTPLHHATLAQHLDGLKILMAHGARTSKRNNEQKIALHIAAEIRFEAGIELLLDHGAAIDTCDKSGRTALQIAAAARFEAGVALLLEHGSDINARDLEGRTALHEAAFSKDVKAHYDLNVGVAATEKTVRLLIANGADVALRDNEGRTASEQAVFSPVKRILKGEEERTVVKNAAEKQSR